jgi:hypothetical protein
MGVPMCAFAGAGVWDYVCMCVSVYAGKRSYSYAHGFLLAAVFEFICSRVLKHTRHESLKHIHN